METIKCDGACEVCPIGKLYPGNELEGPFYTCDPVKIKGVKVIPPTPATTEAVWQNDAPIAGI